MNLEFYQWLVPLIALYFMVRSYRQYMRGKRMRSSLLIWLCFWIILIILSIFPDLFSTKLAQLLGFKSNVNSVIFVALGLLFVISFYYSSLIEKMERQITSLVRKQAVSDAIKEEYIKKIHALSDEVDSSE